MTETAGVRTQPTSPQRGMVLVIVLWIVSLLAVMAGGFAYSMRVETRLATTAVERAQARALAEAGMAYALAWQLDPELRKKWPPNGDPHDWAFGGGRVRIQVTDASGLVDLNNARPELLKALLAGIGVAADDQDRLADAIQDWRDSDDQTSPHGAESADYRTASRPGPKSANFESVDELGQILGISGELYERLANVTTVFSTNASVNPELAPSMVLQTLGLDEQTVADYVAARARAAADGLAAPPLSSDNGSALFSPGQSGVYHMKIAVETEGGAIASLDAVFKGPGGGVVWGATAEQSPRLVAWREGR